MTRPGRRASLVALALVAMQVAWILALPPFRGIDEFDHAYRAAAVAHGQLLPTSQPVGDVHGEYVEVPRRLVEAAGPVCSSYEYTGPANCSATRDAGDGYVEVASGAARYNPVFYWVIGKAAQPFEGTANLYVLRIVAALLCAAFVAAAAYGLTAGFRTGWPLLAAAVSMTPVFVYSTSMGAPNGIEMAAGLALWSALLALHRPASRRQETALVAIAAVAAATLTTTRLLGPLWLGLIVVCAVVFLGRDRLRALVRERRVPVCLGAAVSIAAVSAALVWTRMAAPNSLQAEPDLGLDDPVVGSLLELPLWVFQSIASFPTRNEPAPPVVYAATLVALFLVLAGAGRGRTPRWWSAVGALVALWLGVQLAISVATYAHLGTVWQGRYALPLAVGIPVLLAAAAERAGARPPHRLLVVLITVLVGTAHTVSVVNVLQDEQAGSPLAGSAAWVTAPPIVAALLVAVGGVVFLAAGRPGRRDVAPPMSRPQTLDLEGRR